MKFREGRGDSLTDVEGVRARSSLVESGGVVHAWLISKYRGSEARRCNANEWDSMTLLASGRVTGAK